MESIFSYIILFVLFIQCNSSSYENYLRVNLDIKNFCNNKKQSHDLNAYINKKEIIITKQYDLYTNFVEEYNTILKKKIDIENLKSIINDIGNKHENVSNPLRLVITVNFTNNNNTTKYLLKYDNVKEFLCIIYNTTDNIEVPKMNSVIKRKKNNYNKLKYTIKSSNNQIIMQLELDAYQYYNDTIPIYYELTYDKKSDNYICIYSNGSELNLTKLDKFSEYCFREKSIIKTVDLSQYIKLYNESMTKNTNNKIEGINYNITLNYTTRIINYINYEIVYNKTKYINSLECVCTKEKIMSIERNKVLTSIICTNTTLKCLILENSIRLIQKKLSYIVIWDNTTLYYYYRFKDNKTDIYIEDTHYNQLIINFLEDNYLYNKSLLGKTINKRSLLDGNIYELYTNIKHGAYNIGKDIYNFVKDIKDYKEKKNYIHIDTEYILNTYETLPDMYDLNNNKIEIKVKNYEFSENLLELPDNLNSTSLKMSDIKSLLLLIMIILTFIILTIPLCCI